MWIEGKKSILLAYLFSHRWFIVLVLFTARGAAAGFFQTVYVYTPEVYPTKLRALAMGER